MNSSSRYKSNFQSYDFMATNFSQPEIISETITKLNLEVKELLEEEKLREWRKNLKLIRELSIN